VDRCPDHRLWTSGYVGAPFVRREQLWVISIRDGLLLIGQEGKPQPERIVLNINGNSYEHIIEEDQHSSYRTLNSILSNTQLSQLIDPTFMDNVRTQLEILGMERMGGRDVLVIDVFYTEESGEYFQGRYSIDAHTGVGLRLQQYSDQERQMLNEEMRITDIRYDQDFLAELFVPYSWAVIYFTQGPDGTPEDADSLANRLRSVYASGRDALPRRTPPPDFDPSRSQLTFQYKSLTRLGGARDLAEVFADDYFLGMLEFADPWNINCTRSPNGRYIAYFPYLDEAPYRGRLRWFDLLDLAVVHDPLPDILPAWNNMAFSPVSRQLAFVACSQFPDDDCAIFLLDITSGDAKPLLAVKTGNSLAWSPDGRQLAFLGTLEIGQDFQVYIVNVLTGEVAYSSPLNWETYAPVDPDFPTSNWGLTFRNWDSGLEACSAPPEQ
jgi:hypothetical protein